MPQLVSFKKHGMRQKYDGTYTKKITKTLDINIFAVIRFLKLRFIAVRRRGHRENAYFLADEDQK